MRSEASNNKYMDIYIWVGLRSQSQVGINISLVNAASKDVIYMKEKFRLTHTINVT